jgi:PAS domain S-box-containing protein
MTQDLTLSAFQPVYDIATKQLSGVFAVNLRLDYLNQFLRDLEISRFGQVLILEQNGNIIAASQGAPAAITKHGAFPQKWVNIYDSHDSLLRSLGSVLRDRPDLQTLSQSQYLEFKHNGESFYAVITPLQNRSGLNWQILTIIPKSHFLETIQQITHQTLLFSLLTLAAAVTLGVLATNLLIEHFAQFNRVSRVLAEGDLDQRLPVDSPVAELNGLARAFNRMAEQVQQSFLRIHTALETSEAKFTTIFRTSPDPMAIASRESGRLLEVNDNLLEFFGYTRSEVVGRTALDLNFWNDREQYQQYRELLERQGFVRNLEVQFRTRAGVVKTALLSVEIQNLEGQDCLVVVHRDISDRKRTEEQLRRTEQWLYQHDRLSPSNIYTLVQEPDGHIWFEYISSAAETIHEIPLEQVVQDATLLLNAQHPDDRAGYQEAVLQSMQSLSPFSHQWRIITPSGVVKWLQGNSQPERRENGAIAWHGVVVDITDRKGAELTLQQSEARYRAIVEDQTELIIRAW